MFVALCAHGGGFCAQVGQVPWGMPHVQAGLLHGVLNGDVARNALYMADEEMRTLLDPDVPSLTAYQVFSRHRTVHYRNNSTTTSVAVVVVVYCCTAHAAIAA